MLKCPKTDMVLSLQGRLLEDKFRMVRRLGKGGMASVWLALNTRVDREVAIKLIRPEVLKNDDLVARFRSEAKAAGRIDHPNVCSILDFGIGPVGPYIVMEYLRGHTLSQMIKRSGPLDVSTAARLVRQALVGLSAAHREGIVHRDLKPENIFLHETPGGKLVVKIMDFGVAKFTDGSSDVTTERGALLGTPEYMAPEQFLGADMAEPRTDVWAMGAILYRALTGKHAFKGPTVAATLMMVTNEEATPMRELVPTVPKKMVDVVARCLAKDPKDRFPSASALRDALASFEVEEDPAHPGTSSLRLLLDRVNLAEPDPDPDLPSPDVPLPDPELGAPLATAASEKSTEALGPPPRRNLLPWMVLGAVAVGSAVWLAATLGPTPEDVQARAPTPPPEATPDPDPDRSEPAEPATNGAEPDEPASPVPQPEPDADPEPEPDPDPVEDPPPDPIPEESSSSRSTSWRRRAARRPSTVTRASTARRST